MILFYLFIDFIKHSTCLKALSYSCKSSPNCLGFFKTSFSNKACCCYLLGNFWIIIGLLFIPTSCHTVSPSVLYETQCKKINFIFINISWSKRTWVLLQQNIAYAIFRVTNSMKLSNRVVEFSAIKFTNSVK